MSSNADAVDDDDFDAAFNKATGIEVEPKEEPEPEISDEVVLEKLEPEKLDIEEDKGKTGAEENTEEASRVADLQVKLAAANHATQSEKGRVKALQGQLDEAKNPAEKTSEELKDDSQEDDLESEYPEVGKLVKKQVDALVKPLEEKVEAGVERQAQADETITVTSFYRDVAKKHADFNDIKGSPEFGAWYQEQTPEVKNMANSWDAKNGIAVIDMFKATRPAPKETVDNNDLLDDMEDIPRKGGPKASGAVDDFDRAFDQATKNL